MTKSPTLLLGAASLILLLAGCDKKDASAAGASSAAPKAAPAAAAAEVDCENVVEKIASLNPPDSRGEPEKKLWRAMCAEMKTPEKTCVMGAKDMDAMKGCMADKPLK